MKYQLIARACAVKGRRKANAFVRTVKDGVVLLHPPRAQHSTADAR